MASSSTKASSLFTLQQSSYFQENYLPNYYEQDIQTPASFRSVSVCSKKQDDFNQEFDDDCEALYEAALMSSNFFAATIEKERSFADHPLDRLRQILVHINPNYQSPLCHVLETKSRTQFLSKQPDTNTRILSDPKDKGIPKPTM